MDTTYQGKVLAWFIGGETGISSEAMAAAVTDHEPNEKWSGLGNYPSDPDDLNRCLMFLDAVPEARAHLHKVALLSDTWALLIENWEELERTFLEEAGYWSKVRSAPKTYDLMKRLIEQSQRIPQ